MKKNKTQTGMKKAVVRIIGNDSDGYFAKFGKRMLKPSRGIAAKEGTWVDKDSTRRNVRKQLVKLPLGLKVGDWKYKYEYVGA